MNNIGEVFSLFYSILISQNFVAFFLQLPGVMNGVECRVGGFASTLRRKLFQEHLGLMDEPYYAVVDPVSEHFYKVLHLFLFLDASYFTSIAKIQNILILWKGRVSLRTYFLKFIFQNVWRRKAKRNTEIFEQVPILNNYLYHVNIFIHKRLGW